MLALALAMMAGGVPRQFAFTRLIDEVPPGQVIGRVREGLLCGPGRALRWDQVAKGPTDRLISAADSLLAGETAVPADDPFGTEAKTSSGARYKLAVTITAAKLDLCVPRLGIGNKPKGHGHLDGRIAALDTQTGDRLPDQPFAIDLDCTGVDPRRDISPYQHAVLEALRRYRDSASR